MGIPVQCPNGHHFKVKDKYAGKKGLCPKCPGEVEVHVPDLLTSKDAENNYRQAIFEEYRSAHGTTAPASSESSVLDDHLHEDASSSGSLLGSSVIQHHTRCKCGQSVPMWFAKCPACGSFMEQR